MRSEEGNREGRAGEHMNLKISIGSQDFAFLREHNCFLVDKTDFIKKWWESGDAVTLITRPRRFGKTLNMSMLNCIFFPGSMNTEGICLKDLISGLI